jgi:TPR repeat protein
VPVLKYYDEQTDTAVLKIAGHDLDFFSVLARPVRVGERIYAIGNPRGFEQSISEGIVSGNREIEGTLWIQHSAPISPGSSGGALISSRGELLGINSRFRKESQNLNFAVPVATLARALSGARTLVGFLKFPANADAQLRLGLLYQTGQGVPQDYAQAAAWIREAAEQGNAVAQNFLGFLYSTGQGVPQNYAEAAIWFRKAAAQGHASAQLNLGRAYENGEGVPKNYSESYFWVKLAAEGKAKNASQEELAALLEVIATHLTTAALSQAQEQAREWLSAHPTKLQQELP